MKHRTFVAVVGLVCGAVACNAVMPLDKKPDAGADASPQQEAGSGDAARDGPPGDAPAVDQTAPPDTWPHFDGGATGSCKNLWMSPEIVTISAENDTVAGTSPSIAVVVGTYHIAYVEGKQVKVRSVTPLAPTKNALDKVQVLSDGTREAVNPWLASGPSGKLAAVWAEKTTGYCSSKPMFTEFSPGNAGSAKAHDLDTDSTKGWDPITMVYHQTANMYLFAATLHWASACDSHMKGIHHSFTPGAPTGFPVAVHWGPASWFPTIALSGAAVTPYVILRLVGADGAPDPASVTPELYSSASPNSWSTTPVYTGTAGLPLRPALLGDGAAVWMAWTQASAPGQTGPTVKVVRHVLVGSTTSLEAAVPHSRNPFFARRGDTIALVYSRLDNTGTPEDIELAQVAYAGGTKPLLTIGAGLSLSGAVTAGPDRSVVAGGKDGFGVAWQEKVNGVDEVRFRWVGCLPSGGS